MITDQITGAIMKSFLLSTALLVSTLGSAHAATILNGNFETGTAPGGFTTIGTGNSGITGWTVEAGSVDYIGTYWGASDGNRSIDLNGNSRGTISTTIDGLIQNQVYNLFFAMSGNPAGTPTAKQLDVVLVGATLLGSGNFQYNTQQNNTTLTNMNWVEKTVQFVANATSATLRFISANGGPQSAFGPALDNVRVTAAVVPLPATGLLALAALGCLTLLRRRKQA